jgi:23S rRNA pseudouridine2604 synthase
MLRFHENKRIITGVVGSRVIRMLSKNKNKERKGKGAIIYHSRLFGTAVRLAKRMSELDLCSRREADRLILQQQQQLQDQRGTQKQKNPLILVRGKPIPPLLGQKVSSTETDIVIVYPNASLKESSSSSDTTERLWDRIQYDTVVLHKPLGYVSGQPNDGFKPAVQLLTLKNYYDNGKHNNKSLPLLLDWGFPNVSSFSPYTTKSKRTLQGYVPAGRLDINSTGLLIFTKNGVIAKKLVSHSSNLEKEYLVCVKVPNHNTTTTITYTKPLPSLYPFLQGGHILKDDYKPLLPLVHAEWIEHSGSTNNPSTATLKLVLKEGRKRQIRRMCKELLGMDIISLTRVRIGSNLHLKDLPLGKWRLLNRNEVMDILDEH